MMNFNNYIKGTIILKSLLFFALTSCSNDDRIIPNSTPGTFRVNVSEVSRTGAELSWIANDPDGDILQYSIMLNNQEIADSLSEPSYRFTNLLPNTGYNGRVIATDAENNSTHSDFSFVTTNIPNVHTFGVSNMTFVSVKAGGKLLNSGGSDITQVGLVVDTVPLPTFENNLDKYELQLNNENEFHTEIINLSGDINLSESKTYYIRAYGLNQEGVGYGNEVQCTVPNEFYGNVELRSQADVNTFEVWPYTTITGNLEISGNVSDLSPLSSLVIVEGAFKAQNTTHLMDFSGLKNLKTIGGGFYIENNATLQNFQGLNGLEGINGEAYISNNDAIMDLQGLENVTNVNYIAIRNNNSLTGLHGFNNLSAAGSLHVYNNSNLVTLDGIESLSTLSNLHIDSNDALANIQVLRGLTAIKGDFMLTDNDALINLDGLGNLVTVGGDIFIRLNDNLSNLKGLNNLSSVAGSLHVSSNPSLTNLDDLENLSQVQGSISISNNNMLSDFCGLKSLFESGSNNSNLYISANFENPTVNDIISKCN